MSELFDLSGKVALITGSSKGIGRAIAERMAEHGAKVVVSSRKADICAEVVAGIVEKGGEAISVPCNINEKEQLQHLVDAVALICWLHPCCLASFCLRVWSGQHPFVVLLPPTF